MKLNVFFILTALFLLIPRSVYSVLPLLQILRIERFEKQGHATIDLCGDAHFNNPVQEAALIEALKKQKGHVCVEDMAENVGSKHIQDSLDPELFERAQQPGCIVGLISRLRKQGVSASSVECRSGLSWNKSASTEEIIDDYKKVRGVVKMDNPSDPVDVWSNTIISSVEKNEDACLSNRYTTHLDSEHPLECGFQTLEMLALKELCKKDEHNHKALVAGLSHCDAVGLILTKLGYTRTKFLGESGKKRVLSETYKPYLPDIKTNNYHLTRIAQPRQDPRSWTPRFLRPILFNAVGWLGIPTKPVSPNQIKEYFDKPDSYKAS